jgi:hypothetical protein
MFSEVKTAERNQARRMRYEGRSIKEIATVECFDVLSEPLGP